VTIGDLASMADKLAGLPDQLGSEHEDSKRFDVLLLNAQLSVLRGEPFERQRRKIIEIAGLLEDQQTIPVVAAQLALIMDIQDEEWWVYVSYPMLEEVRKKLRALVPLIERAKKGVIYSDFEDVIGLGAVVELPGAGGGGSPEFVQFRKKAQHYLKEHLEDPVVAKVRSGQPLNDSDVAALQQILASAGIGDDETFTKAAERSGSFGRFVRSLVGLDRAAAKEAFAEFLDETRYSKNQIEFINLIVNYLTEYGVVEPGRVYESPFTTVAPEGPEGLFGSADVTRIFEVIDDFLESAA
jgi:type I restriction enzyme R subunit